jgi:SAM-dependent methyltransferase
MNYRKSIFDDSPDLYEAWFKRNHHIFDNELKAIKQLLPCFEKGIEVGIGAGIFASALGIKEGVEPSATMSARAKDKGIHVIHAHAEELPITGGTYDFVLMVTVDCFLKDVVLAFKEVRRILSAGGFFIVAFIDRATTLGEKYELKKVSNEFYRHANFHSAEEMIHFLQEAGFEIIEKRQTIFSLENINQDIRDGVGEGVFAVIKVKKPDFAR